MAKYMNLRGNSPITDYEIEPTRITILFNTGKRKLYSYSYTSAGREHIEKMKELARKGSGLSAYITKNVRYNYEK